jgi:hypothetical protein
MAKKSVLIEAINLLEKANNTLRYKISAEKNSAKSQQMCKELQKNESMILDYKFRLENE